MKKLGKIGKGLLLLACGLCMAVVLRPETAHAGSYYVFVGGVQVTDDNASNITGEKIQSGTVSYDPDTCTVTLNNATIKGDDSYPAAIYGSGGLKIHLIGTNTVTGPDGTPDNANKSAGIMLETMGSLTFTGDGTLYVSSGELTATTDLKSYGIYADGDVKISGGCTIYASGQESKKDSSRPTAIVEAIHAKYDVVLDGEEIKDARTGQGKAVIASDATLENIADFTYVKISPSAKTYSIALTPDTVKFTEVKGEAVTPQTITVTNTGTGATGELTLALSGSYAKKFEISPTTLASIEAGQSATFTVTPKADTSDHYQNTKVTVTGSHNISSSVTLELYVKPETPILSGLSGGTVRYAKGATAEPLTITVTGTSGYLEYQWAKGSLDHPTYVVGETGATFTPPTDTVGTENYFCIVTHWVGTSNKVTSVLTTVEVYEDAGGQGGSTGTETYSIGVDPADVYFNVCMGEAVKPKTITVTNTGTGATGELALALSGSDAGCFELSQTTLSSIGAGQSAAFTVTPKANTTPGNYGDAKVTVTGSNSISSSVALHLYMMPEEPIISGTIGGNVRYAKGATAEPLTVTVSGTSGTLSYKWAKGSTEAPTYIAGATGASFTPPTDTVGTEIYFCDVSNTINGIRCTMTSAVTTVTVYEGTQDPSNPGGTEGNNPGGTEGQGGTTGGSTGTSGSTESTGSTSGSYQILEGVDGSWTAESGAEYTIRGNGEFSKFTGVKMDGNLVEAGNYTAKEGSTIVTFREAYLNTLSAGTHTVELVWTDGAAATTLAIENGTTADKKDAVPKTGEDFPAAWLLVLAGISGMGLLLMQKSRKKNEETV